jgi:hypothetical protein
MATPKKANGHRGALTLYKSYMFRDKDPAIDEMRSLIERHYGRRVTNKELSQITEDGGPSSSCMHSWFFGKTRRPQNPTIEAAGRAMGYQRVWKRMRSNRPE